ncbi:potassium-transporting ATPase subunit C, partial [Nocardia gipuzkoensis]
MRMSTWIRQHLAALRALLVLTVITGIAYPVAVFA